MLRSLLGLAALTFAIACTPPQPSAGAPPAEAPPKSQAPGPRATTEPAQAQELALARDLEIERLYRAVRPYRRGGIVGLAYLDGIKPATPPPAVAAEWARAAERLRGRFGDLRPLTPLATDLAVDPDLAGADPASVVRRAAAMQGLDYVLIYRIRAEKVAARGWFGGGAQVAKPDAEAAVLDVRTGAILGAVTARAEAKPAEKDAGTVEPEAQAAAALIEELETLGRRLDADAMRAAGPPM